MQIKRAIEILDPEHREHYESIEPVNEACLLGILALKKQIQKKPVPNCSDEYVCPICNSLVVLSSGYKQPFCYQCGQALDWSDTE